MRSYWYSVLCFTFTLLILTLWIASCDREQGCHLICLRNNNFWKHLLIFHFKWLSTSVSFTFFGGFLQVRDVVGVCWGNFEKRHIDFMKKFYGHLTEVGRGKVKRCIWVYLVLEGHLQITTCINSPALNDKCSAFVHLIHPWCCKEDANVIGVLLQFSVLLVTELQMMFMSPIGRPPGMRGRVGTLQSVFGESVFDLTLLKLGTISSTVLRGDK